MEHTDWHPSNFDPNPSEEVTDKASDSLQPFWLPLGDERATPISWHMLLPSSNVVIPDMLTVGIKLQAQVQTSDDRR